MEIDLVCDSSVANNISEFSEAGRGRKFRRLQNTGRGKNTPDIHARLAYAHRAIIERIILIIIGEYLADVICNVMMTVHNTVCHPHSSSLQLSHM